MSSIADQIFSGDVSFFPGTSAVSSTGWLRHPEHYSGPRLAAIEQSLPRRFPRVLLLGMGGSSSPARFLADAITSTDLTIVDTTHPDTVSAQSFEEATVIASSKSGTTVETQTLLAHALATGLDPSDLIIVTDPGTSLAEMGSAIGARVILGDPRTGGRFSALSPFGLVPALLAGWGVTDLEELLLANALNRELVGRVLADATMFQQRHQAGEFFFPLVRDPVTSGAAMWLDQLVAETTGKQGRGFIPIPTESGPPCNPADIMYFQLLAALLAAGLGVDPFNQPDVELAKAKVFTLLREPTPWEAMDVDVSNLRRDLAEATYRTVQAYAPLSAQAQVVELRELLESAHGPTTANLGPRYLHSTGQLHKGGPTGVVGIQVLQRPRTSPVRIAGRRYSFHDLHMAQARSDYLAMSALGRPVYQILVDDVAEVGILLGLTT